MGYCDVLKWGQGSDKPRKGGGARTEKSSLSMANEKGKERETQGLEVHLRLEGTRQFIN